MKSCIQGVDGHFGSAVFNQFIYGNLKIAICWIRVHTGSAPVFCLRITEQCIRSPPGLRRKGESGKKLTNLGMRPVSYTHIIDPYPSLAMVPTTNIPACELSEFLAVCFQ